MTRLVLFLIAILLLATGLSWLADRPGQLLITWEGYEIETSVFRAVVILAFSLIAVIALWSLIRQIWTSPAAIGRFLQRRRQRHGLDALSSGIIAIGAGDEAGATRYALQARKALPNEPLTHLLRAQAAQLSGDRATSRRIFDAMLASPDTELLGLRGLYLEATREGENEAARQYAERANRLQPKLAWPLHALFESQCRHADWAAAAETLAQLKRYGHLDKKVADRRRAVVLTARAAAIEEDDADTALALATQAHELAPDLIPAAAIAARILASRDQTSRAAKIVQKTWAKSPHPDLASAYSYARIGDSPRDRLQRVRKLAQLRPNDLESAVALARAAIEAFEWQEARTALEPYLGDRLTRRVARLMARIETEQHGDVGRARAWMARAALAGPDPVWTADGVVLDSWSPVSPVSGELDRVTWRVPAIGPDPERQVLAERIEAWLAIEAERETELTALRHATAAAGSQPSLERAGEASAGDQQSPEASDVTGAADELLQPTHDAGDLSRTASAEQPTNEGQVLATETADSALSHPATSTADQQVPGAELHAPAAPIVRTEETASPSLMSNCRHSEQSDVIGEAPSGSLASELQEPTTRRTPSQRSERTAPSGKQDGRAANGARPFVVSIQHADDLDVLVPHPPDDPGVDGDELVPQIRTSRTKPPR